MQNRISFQSNRKQMHKTLHIALIILLLAVLLGACSRQLDVVGDPEGSPQQPTETTQSQEAVQQTSDGAGEGAKEQTSAAATSTDESEAAYLERTNRALEHLVLAQLALEDRMPNLALYEINRSLYFLETADGLALKGSIFYLLGNLDQARTFWQNASNMDPNAIHDHLPGIPEAFGR
jgi:tetratricopeptide (TPR) repeat protein